MTRRRPNNGNSLSVVSARNFYITQKAERENTTLNCDRLYDKDTYNYFTNLFDFSEYKKEDRETYRSLYFDSLKNQLNKNKRKELEIICRVLLTQLQTD